MPQNEKLTIDVRATVAQARASLKEVEKALSGVGDAAKTAADKHRAAAKAQEESIKRTRAAAQAAAAEIRGMGTAMSVSMAAIGAALVGVSKAGLTMSETMRTGARSLTIIGGSAADASKLLAALKEEARQSGTDLQQLIPVAQQLAAAYGGDLKRVMPTVEAFADAAAAVGVNTEAMTRALVQFRQIVSTGLQGDEIRSIQENIPGLDIRKSVRAAFGTDDPETLRKAGITGAAIGAAIVEGINRQFGGARLQGAETLTRQASGLRTEWALLAQEMTRELEPALTSAVAGMRQLFRSTSDNPAAMSALRGVMSPISDAMKSLSTAARVVRDELAGMSPAAAEATGRLAGFGLELAGWATISVAAAGGITRIVETLAKLKAALAANVTLAKGLGAALSLGAGWEIGGAVQRGLIDPWLNTRDAEAKKQAGAAAEASRPRTAAAKQVQVLTGLLHIRQQQAWSATPGTEKRTQADARVRELEARIARIEKTGVPDMPVGGYGGLTFKKGVSVAQLKPIITDAIPAIRELFKHAGVKAEVTNTSHGTSRSRHGIGEAIDVQLAPKASALDLATFKSIEPTLKALLAKYNLGALWEDPGKFNPGTGSTSSMRGYHIGTDTGLVKSAKQAKLASPAERARMMAQYELGAMPRGNAAAELQKAIAEAAARRDDALARDLPKLAPEQRGPATALIQSRYQRDVEEARKKYAEALKGLSEKALEELKARQEAVAKIRDWTMVGSSAAAERDRELLSLDRQRNELSRDARARLSGSALEQSLGGIRAGYSARRGAVLQEYERRIAEEAAAASTEALQKLLTQLDRLVETRAVELGEQRMPAGQAAQELAKYKHGLLLGAGFQGQGTLSEGDMSTLGLAARQAALDKAAAISAEYERQTRAAIEIEDAERSRTDSLQRSRNELAQMMRDLEQERAVAAGRDSELAWIDARVKKVEMLRSIFGTPGGDTERPETDEEALARQQKLVGLDRERLNLTQRRQTIETQIAEDQRRAAEELAQLQARGASDYERRQSLQRDLLTAVLDQRTARAQQSGRIGEYREALSLKQMHLGDIMQDLRSRIGMSGGDTDEALKLRLELVGVEDLADRVGQQLREIRSKWQSMWQSLGQSLALSLHGALSGAIEGALMGKGKSIITQFADALRQALTRALANLAAQQMLSGIGALIGGPIGAVLGNIGFGDMPIRPSPAATVATIGKMPAAGGSPAAAGVVVHQTIGKIDSQVDMTRAWDDLGLVLSRRMRTA